MNIGEENPTFDALMLWPTPLYVFRPSDSAALRVSLGRALLDERRTDAGIVRSNRRGWHSRPDLALRPDPLARAAIGHVLRHVGLAAAHLAARHDVALPPLRPQVQGWAMILEAGDHVVVHDHAEADWSVAWYVDAGERVDDDSGTLTFVDVRRVASPIPGLDLAPSQLTVHPEDGMVVVFPGWLPHFVSPYRGTRPRVSVSCNVRYAR